MKSRRFAVFFIMIWIVSLGVTPIAQAATQTICFYARDDGALQTGVAWPASRFSNPSNSLLDTSFLAFGIGAKCSVTAIVLQGDVQALPKFETFPYKNEDSSIVFLYRLASQEILTEQEPDKLDLLPNHET